MCVDLTNFAYFPLSFLAAKTPILQGRVQRCQLKVKKWGVYWFTVLPEAATGGSSSPRVDSIDADPDAERAVSSEVDSRLQVKHIQMP